MSSSGKNISLYLELEVIKSLRTLAIKQERSVSYLASKILKNYLADESKN